MKAFAIPLGAMIAAMTLPPVCGQAEDPVSEAGDVTLLPAGPDTAAGGGRISNNAATVTIDTVTGGAIAGGVSNVTTTNQVQIKAGFTGQLYDATALEVSAEPGTTLNEGDGVQLSAAVTLDDDTMLDTADVAWSVTGPIAGVDAGGLAIAGAVTANSSAIVQGMLHGVSGVIGLSIINLPFEPSPITWEDPTPGGNGPYQVFFGSSIGAMTEVATPDANFFNPGQLALGTTYFFQIFDASGTDITPGGPGPQHFTTSLFRPDMRIGTKGNPAKHKGDNIYNTVGAGQAVVVKMIGKRTGRLHFSVENDGDTRDDHTIRGTRPSRKFKFIRYFRLSGGRANVTAEAIRTGVTEADVAPGRIVSYQVQAKANGKKKAGQTLKIGATSAKDARATDLARGKFRGLVKKRK